MRICTLGHPACACDANPSFWQTKSFLIIVTVLAGVMLAFQYYSALFFPESKQDQRVANVEKINVQSITLDVEGMTCTGCEATVKNAAHSVERVLESDASYETGIATVKYDKSRTNREQIVVAINKTGFTAKENQKNSEL